MEYYVANRESTFRSKSKFVLGSFCHFNMQGIASAKFMKTVGKFISKAYQEIYKIEALFFHKKYVQLL